MVDAHLEELAALEVRHSGHTIGNARWEAGNVRDVLDYYAGAPERPVGRQIPVAGGLDVTFHEPLGVVGVIVPWNFPMPILSWGFAPALAAGNTVVLKPAELTPLTAIRLGELALEAGLPEGVFQVLPGKGSVVGQRFVDHPVVRKIVLHRLDRGRQADHARLRGPGEAAHAGTRRQEREHRLRRRRPGAGRGHRAVRRSSTTPGRTAAPGPGSWSSARCYDRFMELLEPAVTAVRVGDPASEDTEMGPLISAAHRERVASYVPDGAPVAFRGTAPDGPGFWYPPTVLAPVGADRPGLDRGDLRAGRVRVAVRGRGRGDPDGQRLAVRPVRLDLDPRRRPGDPGGPRRSRRATCR